MMYVIFSAPNSSDCIKIKVFSWANSCSIMIMKRLSTHLNHSTASNDDPTQLKQAEESWQYLEQMPLDLLEQKMDELDNHCNKQLILFVTKKRKFLKN